MGGEVSSSKYGSIYLEFNEAFAVSGGVVNGKIYVEIKQTFPCKNIKLQIKGKERCMWYETKTRVVGEGENQRFESYEDKHDEKKTVFDFEQKLFDFPEGSLGVGQYVFPFQFVLPSSCPSSAYFTGDSKALGCITYKCKAKFNAADHTKIDDLKHKTYMAVRQAPSMVTVNLQKSEEVEIKK